MFHWEIDKYFQYFLLFSIFLLCFLIFFLEGDSIFPTCELLQSPHYLCWFYQSLGSHLRRNERSGTSVLDIYIYSRSYLYALYQWRNQKKTIVTINKADVENTLPTIDDAPITEKDYLNLEPFKNFQISDTSLLRPAGKK